MKGLSKQYVTGRSRHARPLARSGNKPLTATPSHASTSLTQAIDTAGTPRAERGGGCSISIVPVAAARPIIPQFPPRRSRGARQGVLAKVFVPDTRPDPMGTEGTRRQREDYQVNLTSFTQDLQGIVTRISSRIRAIIFYTWLGREWVA
ncbi:hypothetical protein E2C01_021892 [Portunus trituberculatus]|uniref:Uncharacterized protein n=1 Tax=Portunus trituberculatus TaxID=210409 RepID=A0A5B7E3S8_PORTR|nr:hypothetical protein [Portunus trituberculatus]